MITDHSTLQELIQEIEATKSQFIDCLSMLDNRKINQVPYEKSWTAGQLCNHIVKSTRGIVEALKMDGSVTERDSTAKIAELKSIFLDFSSKYASPQEILPDSTPFTKQNVVDDLMECFENLNFYSRNTNLQEMIDGGPLGSITKYELLHFVLYHSQRHLRQMKRIYEAVVI